MSGLLTAAIGYQFVGPTPLFSIEPLVYNNNIVLFIPATSKLMPKLREVISFFFFYLCYAPTNHTILDLYISLLSFSLAACIATVYA